MLLGGGCAGGVTTRDVSSASRAESGVRRLSVDPMSPSGWLGMGVLVQDTFRRWTTPKPPAR